jgi:hypothetical protein
MIDLKIIGPTSLLLSTAQGKVETSGFGRLDCF